MNVQLIYASDPEISLLYGPRTTEARGIMGKNRSRESHDVYPAKATRDDSTPNVDLLSSYSPSILTDHQSIFKACDGSWWICKEACGVRWTPDRMLSTSDFATGLDLLRAAHD